MTEKRSAARPRTHLKAEIELNGESVLPCIVRDLSTDGARLGVSEAVTLPASFKVRLTKSGRRFVASVRWRKGDEAGVALEVDSEAEKAKAGESSQMRRLERENAKLRRLIEELRSDPSRVHELLDPAA